MGTSHSFGELSGKIRSTANNLGEVEHDAVVAGARSAKNIMNAAAAAARAKRVKVRSREVTDASRPAVSLKWGPNQGWVHIMDIGARPHFIGPKGEKGSLRHQLGGRASKRARGMALASLFGGTVGAGTHHAINIPGVGWRAYAHHPGSHGKHFVEPANALAGTVATKEMAKVAATGAFKAFR